MDNVVNLDGSTVSVGNSAVVDLANRMEIVMTPELQALRTENEELKKRLEDAVEPCDMTYMSIIDAPPLSPAQLYGQACSGDTITIETFVAEWTQHLQENGKLFDNSKNGVMTEFGKLNNKPCICAGSGPSLKRNAKHLKDRQGIGLVSCLHNFGFLEDLECPADYYITLDSQEICIPELFQGGKREEKYYWDLTKDRTLCASLVTNPKLIAKWQGKILWFNTVIPDQNYMQVSDQIGANTYFNTGGNALGASYYMARAILGAMPIAFIGADFAFSEKKKFHSWDSPYDKMYSGLISVTNVFGSNIKTWQSYFNFAQWFTYIACGGKGGNPTLLFNCTEGGILGAYPNGIIKQIIQMPLHYFINCFNAYKIMEKLHTDKDKRLLY
jgi:hypothetical protein